MIHLDTDTSIEILRGNRTVREKLRTERDRVAISSVVLAELLFGVQNSRDPDEERSEIEDFLTSVDVIPFGPKCAEEYGRIRYALKKAGRTTGATDTFIAATAVAYGATLVTHNTKHFQHIPGLHLEDWLGAA